MKTLTLVRHAKSSWKDRTLRDRDRPLNKRGSRDPFTPPPPGAVINLQGFLVFQGDDPFARVDVGRRFIADAHTLTGYLGVAELLLCDVPLTGDDEVAEGARMSGPQQS